MAGSILLRDIGELNERLQENINYVDLNYSGVKEDQNGKKYITINKGTPVLNAYKLWLLSGPHDYIRRANYGGFFADNLNRYPFSPDSEETIQNDLVAATRELFPTIAVLSCQVKCYPAQKKWAVKVMVADANTGLIAADMIANGESIVFDVNNVTVS